MKNKVKICGVILFISVLFSGCGVQDISLKAKEGEVKKYNKLVEDTLAAYVKSKKFAVNEKENMLRFMLYNEQWGFSGSVKKLVNSEVLQFKQNSIVYDKYFTALGSKAVREVVIIQGLQGYMYINVIWGDNEVISIDRRVEKSEKDKIF